METNSISDRAGRKFIAGFWIVGHAVVIWFLIRCIQEQATLGQWISLPCLSVFISVPLFVTFYSVPFVWLSADGIYVRALFRKRYYPWDSIKQAGILYCMGRGMWYNEIALLKANGSPRRYKDKTFLLRNIGRKIRVSYSEDAKNYIIRHYGPLDFDLSDGREEKSTVID